MKDKNNDAIKNFIGRNCSYNIFYIYSTNEWDKMIIKRHPWLAIEIEENEK